MACCLTLQIQVFRYRDLIKTQTIRLSYILLDLYLLPLDFSFHSLIPSLIYLPFLLLSSFSVFLFIFLQPPPLYLLDFIPILLLLLLLGGRLKPP